MESPCKKNLRVVCGLLWKEERVLLVQRGPQQSHAGQWEFPGGKIEVGESPETALIRELEEELCITVAVGDAHPIVERPLENGCTLILMPYNCQLVSGTVTLLEHQQSAWWTLEEAAQEALSISDQRIVEGLSS